MKRIDTMENLRNVEGVEKLVGIKMPWESVANAVKIQLQNALGKEISCRAARDDYDFWGVRFDDYDMSIAELEKVCSFVGATEEDRAETIPSDGATSVKSIGGGVANKIVLSLYGMPAAYFLVNEDSLIFIFDAPSE